jgi:hypothetical protein
LNLTYARLVNCTENPTLCALCRIINCTLDLRIGKPIFATDSLFSAIKITTNGQSTVLVTSPGEAIQEISHQIREDAKRMGFQNSFFVGYSNNHLGYFTTEKEYQAGGYEADLSFFGIETGKKIREQMNKAMNLVK